MGMHNLPISDIYNVQILKMCTVHIAEKARISPKTATTVANVTDDDELLLILLLLVYYYKF